MGFIRVIYKGLFVFVVGVLMAWISGCTLNDAERYGGVRSQDGQSVVQTKDGGFVIAGTYEQADLTTDFYVFKIDTLGKVVWSKTYGEAGSYDYARSIILTDDGGFVVAGETDSYGPADPDGNICNFWIIKLDALGNKVWDRVYGGPQPDGAMQVIQTDDSGYAVCGYTHNLDAMGMKVYRLDTSGGIIWEKTFTDNDALVAYSIGTTSDGGFIMAGNSSPATGTNGDPDYVIIKMDSSGNVQWSKRYGDSSHEFARSVIQTTDGGYIVAGHKGESFFPEGNADAWILKLDAAGEIQWSQLYGGSGYDCAYSILEVTPGEYVFAGEIQPTVNGRLGLPNAWAVKIGAYGAVEWNKNYGDTKYNAAYDIAPRMDGGFVLAGITDNGLNRDDVYVVRLDSSGNRQVPPKKQQ